MIKKIRLLFLILIFIFIISGCAIADKDKNPVSWEDEILLAKECGMDSMKCCSDEPACFYGQVCCVDPSDPERNYCADNCEFGKEGAFCRKDDPKCDVGGACLDGYCVFCGQENQACCDPGQEEECGSDLLCHKNKCVRCGLAGNPCCAGSKACEGENKTDQAHTECRGGVCVYCGNNGQIPCLREPGCMPGHLLNNDVCLKCGQANLPCCDKNATGYECEENLICELGFCGK